MVQSKRDVLTAHRVVIADNLQERRVIEQLFAEGVLDQTDREEIHAETSRFGKCCLLLDNRAVHSGGAKGAVAPARKTKCFFSNIVSDFAGLFLVAILVRNLTKTEFAPADKKS